MRGRDQPALFTPPGATFQPETAEGWTAQDLDELYLNTPEDNFLRGQVLYVGASSSNVEFFQYLMFFPDGAVQNQLVVGFQDGSQYLYDDISMSEALLFFRAGSAGGMVWDQLRIRGTVFGYKKHYRLIHGDRVWKTTSASTARHEAIPKSGESFAGYHPYLNWKGGAGKTGKAGISLSKKRGSKKVSYFTPANVFGQKLP